MSYTKQELTRAKRFARSWALKAGYDGELKNPQFNERFDRALASEFGRIRRHLIQALKKEIARLHAVDAIESRDAELRAAKEKKP